MSQLKEQQQTLSIISKHNDPTRSSWAWQDVNEEIDTSASSHNSAYTSSRVSTNSNSNNNSFIATNRKRNRVNENRVKLNVIKEDTEKEEEDE